MFMLQEQIETLGSMEYDEKVEFILEQLRSTMAANNYIRAELVHKKVKPAKLDEEKEKLAVRWTRCCVITDGRKLDFKN